MSERVAVAFPGQGAPDLAGVRALAADRPGVAEWIATAAGDEALLDACLRAPPDGLGETSVQQPLLGIAAGAFYRALEEDAGACLERAWHVGPSLGELFAAAGAGALGWPAAVTLAGERARCMQEASGRRGAMASVFALALGEVESICAETAGTVVVASDVSPGQTLISGETEAVEAVCRVCHQRSGKRPLRLPISIAAHSPLMAAAIEPFRKALAVRPPRLPKKPFLSCLDLGTPRSEAELADLLVAQLIQRVRWRELVGRLVAEGVRTVVGVGPTAPLLRQVAREFPEVRILVAVDPETLAATTAALRKEES